MFEVICFIAVVLLIWFETNAFIEYAHLLASKYPSLLDKLHLKDYDMVSTASPISYPDYLTEYHNNFLTRLLSCPICVSIQMGLFFSLFIGLSKFAILSLSGLVLYKLTVRLLG